MRGRVALVTGGGRGIGRAISVELGRRGCAVAVNFHRDERSAQQTVDEITARGGTARPYQASVESWEADVAMVDAVVRDFGHLDLLVCNAGIASRGRSVADTEVGELGRVMAVHAVAAHQLCTLSVPHLRARERGDVIFISSIGTNAMAANAAPYNMAKAAVEALARTLAKEEQRHGIRVNVVAPGLVATDMGDRLARATTDAASAAELDRAAAFGRVCRPQDVADAVAYLVSDRAGLVTGQRLEVDGGWRT